MLFPYQHICTAFVLEIHARQCAVREDILPLCWQKEEVVIREVETEQRIMMKKKGYNSSCYSLASNFQPTVSCDRYVSISSY